MKKKTGIIGLCMLACSILTHAQTITPQVEQRAKEIVSKMTLQEKIEYISGYTSFSLRAIPRLGIPEIRLADGPQGIRNHAPKSTLYPSGILSASTWNRDLLYKLGQGLGQDAKARGVNILLGPGVNIYRAPLCGRNFEYFGEDPYLTGETAKQYILGVQSEGRVCDIIISARIDFHGCRKGNAMGNVFRLAICLVSIDIQKHQFGKQLALHQGKRCCRTNKAAANDCGFSGFDHIAHKTLAFCSETWFTRHA